MAEEPPGRRDKVLRIDLSPRYRYLERRRTGAGGDGMDGDPPKTVTLEEWEVGVALVALSHELAETIAQGDTDDGMVEYVKILSGIVMKLEEVTGGPAE